MFSSIWVLSEILRCYLNVTTKKMPSVTVEGSNLHSAASGVASAAEKKSIKVLCSHCEKILVPIETEEGELSSLEQCIFYIRNSSGNFGQSLGGKLKSVFEKFDYIFLSD